MSHNHFNIFQKSLLKHNTSQKRPFWTKPFPEASKNRVNYIDHCCFFYHGDIKSASSFQQIMKALFITLCMVLFELWCQIQNQTGDWSSRYPVCKHMNGEAAWGKAGPLRSRDGLRGRRCLCVTLRECAEWKNKRENRLQMRVDKYGERRNQCEEMSYGEEGDERSGYCNTLRVQISTSCLSVGKQTM